MFPRKNHHEEQDRLETSNSYVWLNLGIAALFAIAGSLFFLKRRSHRPPGKKIDIEIRYDTEKNAEVTFLAQNLVKVIRMVLTPIESKINKEGAKLIFVYGENSWEMRVSNGSEKLRHSVRHLLEKNEW